MYFASLSLLNDPYFEFIVAHKVIVLCDLLKKVPRTIPICHTCVELPVKY